MVRLEGFEPPTCSSGALRPLFHQITGPVSFHSLTSIRGFCFRSPSNPFPANFLDFWNTSVQVAQRPKPTSATAGKARFSQLESLLPSIGISKRRLK